jgi:hypothetical protein
MRANFGWLEWVGEEESKLKRRGECGILGYGCGWGRTINVSGMYGSWLQKASYCYWTNVTGRRHTVKCHPLEVDTQNVKQI